MSATSGKAPATFLEILDGLEAFGDETGFTFVRQDGSERFVGYRTLLAEARARGRRLLSTGLVKGDRVAIIIPEAEEFVLSFLAAMSVGLVPVPLYPPLALARLDTYLDTTVRILDAAVADLLLTTSKVEKVLWSVMGRVPSLRDLVTVEKLAARPETHAPHPTVTPEDTVFLQFTSGSTAAPKGVVVTQGSLAANTYAIIHEGLQAAKGRDVGVSWLPLYHDMGLIGFVLAPLVTGISIVFIPTLDFVKRPTLWMDLVHKHRGTLTFAPNFAFARLTKRAKETDLARWDLSCLRVVGCGAEPIHPGTMRAFVGRFAACGLKPEAMLPCYGMAEATLAISFVGLSDRLKVDSVDADAVYDDGRALPATGENRLELISCGRPFLGHEVAIFDEAGRRLGERQVGEIRVRGPSVAGGYFRDPEATRNAFQPRSDGGWLQTGDLGYLADGELYISGRKKDILIIHGRNYYPQSIEWQVEEIDGVRKGNVVAFSVPGEDTEEVVIVAETTEISPERRAEMAAAVKQHLNKTFSLAVRDVVLLGVGELPKTTSGKLQRRKTRAHYLDRSLGREGVRTMGAGERLTLARHLMLSWASRVGHRATTIWPWWPMSIVTKRRAKARVARQQAQS